MSDNDICTRNESGNIQNRTNVGTNEMKILRKIVGKAKIDKIRSQQIRESYSIEPINDKVKRKRKE
jgi:hypothetical protein